MTALKRLVVLVFVLVGFAAAQEEFEPRLYEPFGVVEVGEYEPLEGFEPGVNDADFLDGALAVTTVSPDGQGVDVVIIGPDGYKNVIEVAETQLVEDLMPGTYVLMATDDGLEMVSGKVEVSAGRVAPVTLTLSEIGATAFDAEVYEPYGLYEVGTYDLIDTAELGDLLIDVSGVEGVNIVGSIVGPNDFREEIDEPVEEIDLSGLVEGVYQIALSAEGFDVVEGLADVRAGEAGNVSLTLEPLATMEGQAPATEAVAYAFTDFDADGDGFISEEEFGAVYDNPELFGQFDTDGDGLVGEEEFTANEGLLE